MKITDFLLRWQSGRVWVEPITFVDIDRFYSHDLEWNVLRIVETEEQGVDLIDFHNSKLYRSSIWCPNFLLSKFIRLIQLLSAVKPPSEQLPWTGWKADPTPVTVQKRLFILDFCLFCFLWKYAALLQYNLSSWPADNTREFEGNAMEQYELKLILEKCSLGVSEHFSQAKQVSFGFKGRKANIWSSTWNGTPFSYSLLKSQWLPFLYNVTYCTARNPVMEECVRNHKLL